MLECMYTRSCRAYSVAYSVNSSSTSSHTPKNVRPQRLAQYNHCRTLHIIKCAHTNAHILPSRVTNVASYIEKHFANSTHTQKTHAKTACLLCRPSPGDDNVTATPTPVSVPSSRRRVPATKPACVAVCTVTLVANARACAVYF